MNFEQVDIPITNNSGWQLKDGYLQKYEGVSKMVNYKAGFAEPSRPMVVFKVNGHNVPFYLSSGAAGKDQLGVASGKWYPIFGIWQDPDPTSQIHGWVNKGSINEMKNHYGSSELKSIAEHLDATIGDIRGNKAILSTLPQFTPDGLANSPELRSTIQGSFQQYPPNDPRNYDIRAKNLEILKTPKTLPPPPTPTSTAMPKWTPPPHTPFDSKNPDAQHKAYVAEGKKLKWLKEKALAKPISFDEQLNAIRGELANNKQSPLTGLSEADLIDLTKRAVADTNENSNRKAKQTQITSEFGEKERQKITWKHLKKAGVTDTSALNLEQNKAMNAEIDNAFAKNRAKAGVWQTTYQAEIDTQILTNDLKNELIRATPAEREAIIKNYADKFEAESKVYTYKGFDPTVEAQTKAERKALYEIQKKALETASKEFRSGNGSYTGESTVEVAVRKAKAGLATAAEKTKAAGAAVGGAVKDAGAAVLPATGRTTPLPSEVVRPTTATATSAPIPPKPATPVPAGLPPPPSAAPAASTPPAGFSGTTAREGGGTISMPAADDAQAQLARLNGQGGVAGVSREGVAVNLTTAEELAGTKPAPVDKTNANSIRPPSYENPVQVKVDTPSETTAKQTELRRAQLEEQARTGKLPPKSGVSAKLEEGGSLLDIAKRQLPTVFKVANYITGTSLKDINKAETERLTAEAKVKADAKAALARLTEKPAKTFYNPNTGRSGVVAPQLTAQQASGVMSPLGDRISRTLYSDILPYARGIQNPQVQLPAVFGNDVTQKSFIEKALVRSGRFTADEIGGVVRSILNNPDAMSELTRVIGHLPVENQPLKSGGAPKPLPQRPTGNSLPKVTPVVETARDRLAVQRQLQAQLQAEAQAIAEAERVAAEAEARRIDAENRASETARQAAEQASLKATQDYLKGRGVTRMDRLRQIAIENKKGVSPLEVKYARITGGVNENLYGSALRRNMEFGVKPPSAGARVAGQVGNVGAQGVGFLPDIMTAYALSRGGPISGSGQVLYPHEVTVSDGATYEKAALEGLARYHPMNAANNPDVTNRQRQEYIKDVMGKGESNPWFKSDIDAWDQDLADWVKRTGFTPEPMRGSQPVPQAILDAIRSQR